MEIASARRKKRHIRNDVGNSFQSTKSLHLYVCPPTDTISLQEFEEYAIERLKVLKAVETSGIKHIRGSDEYDDALFKELRKSAFKNIIKAEVDEDTLRIDLISHFILRLAYCKSEEMRRWFIQQELDFFKFRFEKLKDKPNAISGFLKANNLNYSPISSEERGGIRDKLQSSSGSAVVETSDYYKVPFVEALDLVRGRKVYLSQGYAYVPQKDFVSIVLSLYRAHISRALAVTFRALPHLEEDRRLLSIMSNVSRLYLGQDFSTTTRPAGLITSDMIDTLSKKSFPLCMQQLHREFRKSHHLKHGGRMQYGLFLKGIGLSLDESLKFWRGEFTKVMDVDKFDKQYAYNVRHNYGKEGKRTDYTPYSCNKIIMSNTPAQGDFHGCPFRHTDGHLLQQQLRSSAFSKDGIDNIMHYVKGGHYQLACARYFELSHSLPEDANINLQHPNQYFEESQRYSNVSSDEIKTPSRVVKVFPSQTDISQPNVDMSGIDELMADDLAEAQSTNG